MLRLERMVELYINIISLLSMVCSLSIVPETIITGLLRSLSSLGFQISNPIPFSLPPGEHISQSLAFVITIFLILGLIHLFFVGEDPIAHPLARTRGSFS
jgi:hypothetical protein